MKIILGSSSKGRKLIMDELAKELNFTFEIAHPDIDEKAIRFDDPQTLVTAIANAKADALISKIKEPAIIICSDQVVLYKNKIREKPTNKDEARQFLNDYSTYEPETIGAVVVVNTANNKRACGIQTSKIHFKPLTKEIIDEHVESGASLDGAGGFIIHDQNLSKFIHKIEGGFDSATGLSKELVKKLIKEVGGKI